MSYLINLNQSNYQGKNTLSKTVITLSITPHTFFSLSDLFKINLQGFYSCWTKIYMAVLCCVISVVCLCCPILALPYFFISQQMECSCLPVCWRNLSQEHGCKLFSPVRWDFIFTAQQSSQCMLSCLSPRRIEKQDARRAAFQTFSSHFGFLWHSPGSFSLSLSFSPPTYIPLSCLSLFYPDCIAPAKLVCAKIAVIQECTHL